MLFVRPLKDTCLPDVIEDKDNHPKVHLSRKLAILRKIAMCLNAMTILISVGVVLAIIFNAWFSQVAIMHKMFRKTLSTSEKGFFNFPSLNLIMLGAAGFCVVASIIGSVGVSSLRRMPLIIYIVLICVTFMIELGAFAVTETYGHRLAEAIQRHYGKTLHTYEGYPAKDNRSAWWDFTMIRYKCCGYESLEDFSRNKTPVWYRKAKERNPSLEVPYPCCSIKGSGKVLDDKGYINVELEKALEEDKCGRKRKSYHVKGCKSVLIFWNRFMLNAARYILIALIGATILSLVFAVILKLQNKQQSPEKQHASESMYGTVDEKSNEKKKTSHSKASETSGKASVTSGKSS